MELVLIALGLFIVGVIELPNKVINWHVVPKTTVAMIVGALAIVMLTLPLTELRINLGPAQCLALAWAMWHLGSCMWAPEPRFGFRSALTQLCFVLLFILGSSTLEPTDLQWIAIAGVGALILNIALCIYQHYRGDPWIRTPPKKKGDKPGRKFGEFGTLGNRNWYAGFVIPSVGFVMYLAVTCHWTFGLVILPALWTLKLGRSKSALAAFTWGLAFAAIPFMWDKWVTARKRLYFLRAGFFLIKERPLFGWGPRMFRREVYRAHAKINEETKGTFLDRKRYDNPKPRETHNDYVGWWVDSGLIGLLLFLGAVLWPVVSSVQSLNLAVIVILYATVGCLIDGLVFYPFRQAGMAVPFWTLLIMLEVLVDKQQFHYYTLSVMDSLLINCTVTLIILKSTYNYFMSSWWANRAYSGNDPTAMDKALRLDPNNNLYLTSLLPGLMKQDVIAACSCASRVIEHFDGDTVPWVVWTQYGQARLGLGSLIEAKKCFEIALQTYPGFQPAVNGIKQCNQVLRNGGQITIDFLSPEQRTELERQQKEQQGGLQNSNT